MNAAPILRDVRLSLVATACACCGREVTGRVHGYNRVRAVAGKLVVLRRFPLCAVCEHRSRTDANGVVDALLANERGAS